MKKHKHKYKQKITSQSLRLKDNHTWKAPKGYKIVVLDRGAVSFNIPEGWLLAKLEPHVEMHDNPPPNDNARLSVSFWRTPPGINWTGLPLKPLLAQSVEDSDLEILARGEIISFARSDLEIVWTERRFLDPEEKREANSRIAMARGWDIHVLITFDFWVDDLEKLKPMWEEILHSLQLGRHITDPTKGAVLH
jgi:hypothetical protein